MKVLLLFVALIFAQQPDSSKWRPLDGRGHNPLSPDFGATGIQLRRLARATYADGISSARLAVSGRGLPSPRLVSDRVFTTATNFPSRRGLTDFVTYWGQFIDHDFGLTGGPRGFASPPQPMDIAVPQGDLVYDPSAWGNQSLSFFRSVYDTNTGSSTPRQQINLVTSWMDGSQVYGCDSETSSYLRTGTGGLLKTFIGGDSFEYPVFNDGGIVMQNDARYANASQLFIFGDVRGNENPGLATLQIVFVREHNRKARELGAANPSWTDEQIFQETRKFIIGIIQHITEEEYIPITLGLHQPEYNAWNYSLSPDIFTEFSTGAFRYGHSEVNSWLYRLDAGHHPISQGHLRLFSNYFNSQQAILSAGVEPILFGMSQQAQGAVDTAFVDDLKNFLNGPPRAGGSDLISINIQRGRDHGLPGFNEYRAAFGLKPYTSWADINPDPQVYQALANTYESIDDCDVYVCGLAEVPYSYLSNLGETFFTVVSEQYHRLKDSDRFWYEADGYLSNDEEEEIRKTTLSDLIIRNTGIQRDEIQCFVMALPDGCGQPVAPPTGVSYDFLVTLQHKTPAHPLFGLENDFGFSINGGEGSTLVLERGRTYTFYAQISCAHSFLISTEPDTGDEFNNPYSKVVNNMGCLHQNPLITVTIDNDTPDQLFYLCSLHSWMGGNITIVNPPVATQQMGQSSSPKSSSAEANQASSNGKGPVTVALGILVPVLVVIILILIVAVVIINRKKNQERAWRIQKDEKEIRDQDL